MSSVNYNDGNWHGHNGGECPVHPETVVACVVLCSDGLSDGLGSTKAKEYTWHNNHDSPIIAFRVIKEHRDPREFWITIFDGMAWGNEDAAVKHNTRICGNASKIIHVREVSP